MRFLVIQTAFLGDVILATAVIEKLHRVHPDSHIDLLVRKGNENVVDGHPFLHEVITWDKKKGKIKNMFAILNTVRKKKYDHVINLHRFASSGFITAFSGAKNKIGFKKNPFSFLFTEKYTHSIGDGTHEVQRNNRLLSFLKDEKAELPKLYPSQQDIQFIRSFTASDYVTIAPASIWFTKRFPKEKWIELIREMRNGNVYLIGSAADLELCEEIRAGVLRQDLHVQNLAGTLTLLQTAALMKNARMNYVNDSAPLHIASAMNAPVTAIFCSTVPAFGFGPLSERSRIIETKEKLSCRPCGLHGYTNCPEGHFKCALTIGIKDILQ